MTSDATPEQAILAELAAPLGSWGPVGEPAEGRPQAGVLRGGRSDEVHLESVRFVKQRACGRRRVMFVTYEARDPRFGAEPIPGTATYPVERTDGGGWRTIGYSGGLGDEPQWSTPRVNLGGRELPAGGLYAGGRVHTAGHDIAKVQLRFCGVRVAESPARFEAGAARGADAPGTPSVRSRGFAPPAPGSGRPRR